jgi:hypothetical protein
MAFWFPASVQRGALRYLLSLAPIDMNTVDAQQLDLAWGKLTTLELRDVGLDIKVGLA